MKKVIFLSLSLILLITGCSSELNSNNNTVEELILNDEEKNDTGIQKIKDNVFIQITNDMYTNSEDYENKKFEIEGLVMNDDWDGKDHFYIIRRTPGCCGNDGMAGLEVYWNGNMPSDNKWVVGKGVWKKYESAQNGWILVLYSLVEKDKKGNEFLEYNY